MLKVEMQKVNIILKVEHEFEQCAHILKKKESKPFAKSSRTKQFHKSSYTILKGPSEEKRGEQAKAKINAF